MWAAADFTSCTLRSDAEPFLLVWFVIEDRARSDDGGMQMPVPEGFAADGTPDSETRQALEEEVRIVVQSNHKPGLEGLMPLAIVYVKGSN